MSDLPDALNTLDTTGAPDAGSSFTGPTLVEVSGHETAPDPEMVWFETHFGDDIEQAERAAREAITNAPPATPPAAPIEPAQPAEPSSTAPEGQSAVPPAVPAVTPPVESEVPAPTPPVDPALEARFAEMQARLDAMQTEAERAARYRATLDLLEQQGYVDDAALAADRERQQQEATDAAHLTQREQELRADLTGRFAEVLTSEEINDLVNRNLEVERTRLTLQRQQEAQERTAQQVQQQAAEAEFLSELTRRHTTLQEAFASEPLMAEMVDLGDGASASIAQFAREYHDVALQAGFEVDPTLLATRLTKLVKAIAARGGTIVPPTPPPARPAPPVVTNAGGVGSPVQTPQSGPRRLSGSVMP